MLEFLTEHRKSISLCLKDFLENQKKDLRKVNRWGEDVLEKMEAFTLKGKMIRGSLILFTQKMFGGGFDERGIKAAAALELIQSALLIHDDIMDRDEKRRRNETIYFQYQGQGKKEKLSQPRHFGLSMGICAGDIGFFLAFDLLSQLDSPQDIAGAVMGIFAKELNRVGLAQMEDVYLSMSSREVSEEEIESVYRYKTARYTFSLPFLIGAVLCGQDEEMRKKLGDLGEALGILFQIRDDELGIFGDEKEIGKLVGSDILEEKKTLYYYYLFKRAEREERKTLEKIFGGASLAPGDLDFVRRTIVERKIDQEIERKKFEWSSRAENLILSLKVGEEYRKQLRILLEYNRTRKK